MRHDVQVDAELGVRTFACVRRQAPCSVCGRSIAGAGGTDLCPPCSRSAANRAVAP